MFLSTVILTKNEEKNIKRAVRSVLFSSEVIVIDDNSTDKTIEIAKDLGCKVFIRSINGDFSAERNFGMEKAQGDWILFLDSDEEITPELRAEILEVLKNESRLRSFYIKRRDLFWSRSLKHGEVNTAYSKGFIRLFKKGSGSWKNSVHEVFETHHKTGHLIHFINHYPHENVTEFIHSVNYYSTLRSKELFHSGKRTNVWQIIFYPFMKFFYTYFVRLGFLDGPAGFVYSFLMSFHSFLVRAKLYQYEHISK